MRLLGLPHVARAVAWSCVALAASSAPAAESLEAFLENHCVRCHGPQREEGDIRIDRLSRDFTAGEDTHQWAEALEKLNSGEMPPAEEPQPTQAEITAFVTTLDALLKKMLLTFMTATEAANYSWHSARIYLACALLAAGASHGQIQALCRWVSEQSLHIYARLNETTYAYWVDKAMKARVDSSRTTMLMADLPQTEDDACMERLAALNIADIND